MAGEREMGRAGREAAAAAGRETFGLKLLLVWLLWGGGLGGRWEDPGGGWAVREAAWFCAWLCRVFQAFRMAFEHARSFERV